MSIRSYPSSYLGLYATKGKAAAFTVPASKQLYVFNMRAMNNSGSTINVGIMRRLVTSEYAFYQYVASGTTYTNASTALNAGTATVAFAGANNDGFAVQSQRLFSMVGLTISTAQSGGVFTYKYWNGSAFTTLTTLEVPTDYSATGDIYAVFVPPSDWTPGGSTGLDQSKYSILVQSTTAPAAAVSVNAIWTGQFLEFIKGVANNAGVQVAFPDSKPLLLEGGEGLFPYFSTASASNQFASFYAIPG